MVPAEILERREVLSGTPITLAQAQIDAAAAQTALDGAVSSYIASMVTLEGQLESETAAHQATFTTSATTAVGLLSLSFGSSVESRWHSSSCAHPVAYGLRSGTPMLRPYSRARSW